MKIEIKGKSGATALEGLGRPADAPLVFGPKALEGGHLYKLAEGLAKGFPDRIFGTETGRRSAEWLAKELKRAGVGPGVDGSFLQEFDYPIGTERWPGQNVVGLLRGTDPQLRDEFIIVSAHHDSQEGTVLGANDNASGCALVLALAQAFAKNPPKRSILFVTFDGEEALKFQGKNQPGRRGSKVYAAEPVWPLQKTALMVNADMIGLPHLESGPRNEIYQWSSRDNFARSVLKNAAERATQKGEVAVDGYPEQHPQAQMFTTDAEPLYRLGVPIVNFLSGRDLDNHQPQDDMLRLLPDRMEQYARLAYECVLEAGNRAEPLAAHGVQPGGLMPSYPLIKHQKSAGASVIEEEQLRLNDLAARLPELKATALKLGKELGSAAIAERAGIDWAALKGEEASLLREPVLHRLRSLRAELVDQSHDIPKNDLKARRVLQPRLATLSAIEDVLQGAIYLTKLANKGSYYLQQIPPRLGEMLRGARALGLEAKLEGVVVEKDAAAFRAIVNADRAVQIARDNVGGLGRAASAAAFAILHPIEAGQSSKDLELRPDDLSELRKALIEAGQALRGEPGDDARRTALVKVMLQQQLVGLSKAEPKWVDKFKEKNAFVDFGAMVPELGLAPAVAADLTQKAEALMAAIDRPGGGPAILEYYSALTEVAFGAPARVNNFGALRQLGSKKSLDSAFAAAADLRALAQEQAAVQAAPKAPELERLSKLANLVGATLQLSQCFEPRYGNLQPEQSLAGLKEHVDSVREAAQRLPGTEDMLTELSFWSRWLGEYIPHEATAAAQAKKRQKAAGSALDSLPRIWRTITDKLAVELPVEPDDLSSPGRVRRSLELRANEAHDHGDKESRFDTLLKRLDPYFAAEEAARELRKQPSPQAEATLRATLPKLKEMVGAEVLVALGNAVRELEQLQGFGDLMVTRKERGAPLGLLAAAAVQRGAE